ncbi:MAG: isoprenyl transferase [Rhodobacteraceae bacterium]|nr:isoprenyl transferase [Paracoccaceae bacterium]MCY4195410.1 isoprenyl transferase [Paracoccaceae bacterium]
MNAGLNHCTMPRHVALIMDGNGRWAAKRKLPRLEGHRAGAEALRAIVQECPKLDVRYLTVFAFSTENWRRDPAEVNELMALMRDYADSEINQLQENGVRVEFIGDLSRLDNGVAAQLETITRETRSGDRLRLTVAVNYGARAEITAALRHLAARIDKGDLDPDDINESVMQTHLMTADLPDPDLIIRTSGELRLSNFLLWQSAYSEFEFVDTLWPDFTPEVLRDILIRYPNRSRRFGANGK